jgi:hypothetical protein
LSVGRIAKIAVETPVFVPFVGNCHLRARE